jgi:pyruvate dehydrogenase E1 component alpha subunit
MPREIVTRFDVPILKILDEEGNCDEALKPDLSDSQIKEIFELMILVRAFDDVAVKLQREGRIGTYASARGQEAAQVASVYALESSDWMFPSFRENPAYIAMGLPMEMIYEYWGGDERGNKIPENINAFTVAVPVGTQIPHAVGFAWAAKLKGDRKAVLVYFGDGATSKGDFHEGANFAGTFKVPVVFLCENNQWAISVPRSRQTASQTLAQKALAYGFEGIQVDGNDVFAVYKATKEALEKARSGKGPTMIEYVTYRIADHTTSDDASRYRPKEEVEAWVKRDPIDRLRKYLQRKGLWNEEYEKGVQAEAMTKVQQAVRKAESITPQEIKDLFVWTYAELPAHLKTQYEELLRSRGVERND